MASKPERLDPFKYKYTRDYVGHKKKVHSVAWNCNGKKLASGSVDQTVRVWPVDGVARGKDVELKGHADSVDQLCWDPANPDVLASTSSDKSVRVWDARSGKNEQTATFKASNINIAYNPSATTIAVGSEDDEVLMLDVRKLRQVGKPLKFSGSPAIPLNEFAWSCGGSLFFVTTGNGTVEVLSFPELGHLHSLKAHTAGVYSLAIDPKARYFAVGSADALVSLWDIREMLCVRTFTKLEWPVRTVSISYDGKYIAAASEDLFIDISSTETGRQVHMISTRAAMNSVEWNPRHSLLAYASDEGSGVPRVFGFDHL